MTPTKKTTTTTRKPKHKPSVTIKARAPQKTVPLDSLPQNPFVHEVLELASSQRANAKKVEALKIGPGLDKNSDMGPLITKEHL